LRKSSPHLDATNVKKKNFKKMGGFDPPPPPPPPGGGLPPAGRERGARGGEPGLVGS